MAFRIAGEKGFTLHLFEVGSMDHVHCFVSALPKLSVNAEGIDAKHAVSKNRIYRGLYSDKGKCLNADALGAYNILRLYMKTNKINLVVNTRGLSNAYVLKVAV